MSQSKQANCKTVTASSAVDAATAAGLFDIAFNAEMLSLSDNNPPANVEVGTITPGTLSFIFDGVNYVYSQQILYSVVL